MDGRTDGRTHARTDARTDGRTAARTDDPKTCSLRRRLPAAEA